MPRSCTWRTRSATCTSARWASSRAPRPRRTVVLAAIAAKLHLVPRYRQRVRFPPLALARPIWVDDRHFHLDYHVRRTALPAPGGDEELRNLVGRVMAQKLDRAKPLWEMWIAEGLDERPLGAGQQAAPLHGRRRLRHGPAERGLRRGAPARRRPRPVPWKPAPEPSTPRIVGSALAHRAKIPYEGVRSLWATARAPGQAAGQAAELARAVIEPAHAAAPAGRDVAQRADRTAPPLGVGARAPGRRQGDPDRVRRHRQRRRARRDRARLPRPAA